MRRGTPSLACEEADGDMRVVHGGLGAAELRSLGLLAEEVIDFSASINPLGTSELVRTAISNVDVSAYPDPECLLLKEALAARLNVETDRVMIGNGCTELIHLLAQAWLRPGDRCLIFSPTFGEYEVAAVRAGAKVQVVHAAERDDFRWSVEAAGQLIRKTRSKMAFFCNPNNPTGSYFPPDQVSRLQSAMAGEGLLILDNSYGALADTIWDFVPLLGAGNIAILRSMTKDHALAGLRLGYLLSDPSVVRMTRQLQPAWSVNSLAQRAGLAALDDNRHLFEARRTIAEAKEYLYEELGRLGAPFISSAANFMLVRVGDAKGVRSALMTGGIAVRDCTSFGMPQWIRISVRRPEECRRLVRALGQVLADE